MGVECRRYGRHRDIYRLDPYSKNENLVSLPVRRTDDRCGQ
jgi:hypothetical protein